MQISGISIFFFSRLAGEITERWRSDLNAGREMCYFIVNTNAGRNLYIYNTWTGIQHSTQTGLPLLMSAIFMAENTHWEEEEKMSARFSSVYFYLCILLLLLWLWTWRCLLHRSRGKSDFCERVLCDFFLIILIITMFFFLVRLFKCAQCVFSY